METWETFILAIVLGLAYISGKFDFPYGFVIAILIVFFIMPFLSEYKRKQNKRS